jgi:hypothetical protein
VYGVACGAALGITYCCGKVCGMIAAAGVYAGGHAVGGHGATTGVAYVVGPQYAPRLNQVHGLQGQAPRPQQLHPAVAGRVATASMIINFFMFQSLREQQSGDYCLGGAV